jgi:hypothetical protein
VVRDGFQVPLKKEVLEVGLLAVFVIRDRLHKGDLRCVVV